MIRPFAGALLILASLSACVAPLTAPEAQGLARERMVKYCRRGACGDYKLGQTQKIKDRWLVDFEAPKYRFTVAVSDDGNAKVTVWNRQP